MKRFQGEPVKAFKDNDELVFKFDTSKLHSGQKRLIRSLNAVLSQVVGAENEAEFFENSAELMRLCASLIQQARFTDAQKNSSIPYADQALEYSMDVLFEAMEKSKVVQYDN